MKRSLWLTGLLVLVFLSGCTINRDLMFKTPRGYEFDVLPDTVPDAFTIKPNDALQFRVFPNDGFRMIDMVGLEMGGAGGGGAGRQQMMMQRMQFNYNVEQDGLVKVPLLGRVKVDGLTLREAEAMLEERYAEFYVRPFVQLLVVNRRVVVFPGSGGAAIIVPLQNNNTTLLEVLADAGGITRRGRSARVKIFRLKPEGGRYVYQVDLSDIEGLKQADMVMDGDDVVYVEPNPDLAREALRDLTPVVSLLTSVLLLIGIARSFR